MGFRFSIIIDILFFYIVVFAKEDDKGHSMIKEIDGVVYVGGKNMLSSYELNKTTQKLEKMAEVNYNWEAGIMNGSAMGVGWGPGRWPENFVRGPKSYTFDTCLSWKQEHKNATVRDDALDFRRWFYHSPSGDFIAMNYTCMNSFIKAVQRLDNDTLWVCGTFGAFPRAFAVHKSNLTFIKFVDTNVMSCSRYVDEPMATHVTSVSNELYVASGWGLYRPNKTDPDIPNNNSTMLYSQWRLFRNLYTLPSAMGLVLSSDVNFIDVVKETDHHLYFFGHEINSQYGLNNQDDRNAWQSFMLRICKNDMGFTYDLKDPFDRMDNLKSNLYSYSTFNLYDYMISPSLNDLNYIPNLPKKHFVTPLKINFGCYISKRPRAISDNHFWGETNVVYLNKLVDVVYDPEKNFSFITKNEHNDIGCNKIPHSQIPLLGLFNGPGIVGTGMEPTGALCQLQINKNIFAEESSKKGRYSIQNNMQILNAFEELMAISSTSTDNFYGKNLRRTNGFTLYPYWNQGVMIGRSDNIRDSFINVFTDIGKCQTASFYENLKLEEYLKIQNFTNTAWPNEMANRLTSVAQAMCQYYAAELINFNATFVMPGVEFKRMFVIADNITTYQMHKLKDEGNTKTNSRKHTSPLMVVGIVSTTGVFYRVVLCDFDNGMRNHGYDKTDGSWYNWCIFRHTNQPYLYRQFIPMENRQRDEPALYRASSLLLEKKIVNPNDLSSFPRQRDPQFHVVKGILQKGDYIHVVTTDNLYSVPLRVDCSQYTQCIDCASDPLCMWSDYTKGCIKYNHTNYRDEEFVQDVLDRGFKCSIFIKLQLIKTNEAQRILHCNNVGYWRGKVIWKYLDNGAIDGYVMINDSFVMLTKDIVNSSVKITVFGLKDDKDKLFNGQEYDWISNRSGQNYESLCTFEILRKEPHDWIYSILWIVLVISLVTFVIVIIIILVRSFKIKRIFKNNKNPIIEVHKEDTFSSDYPLKSHT